MAGLEGGGGDARKLAGTEGRVGASMMALQSLLDLVITTLRADLRCGPSLMSRHRFFRRAVHHQGSRAARIATFLSGADLLQPGHYDYSYQLLESGR